MDDKELNIVEKLSNKGADIKIKYKVVIDCETEITNKQIKSIIYSYESNTDEWLSIYMIDKFMKDSKSIEFKNKEYNATWDNK